MTTRALARDVGQLIWVGFRGTEAPDYLRREISAGKIGATVLFRRNLVIEDKVVTYAGGSAGAPPDVGGAPSLAEQATRGSVDGGAVPAAAVTRQVVDIDALRWLIEGMRTAVADGAEPLLVAVDQEGGRVQRVRAPATVWPPMLRFDRLPDDRARQLAREVGTAMGRELAALGFDVDFAPVLDVHTNPANPIIGDRAFAADAARAADRALAFADGLTAAGIIPCGKHFPGHGDTTTDSHLELPRVDHDLARLRAVELLPFERAARAELPMLMTAHVLFAALDPERPATMSPRVIGELLRGELGYRGVVVSDDLDMKAIADNFGAAEAAVASVEAGCDALLLCCDRAAQAAAFDGLVAAGERDSDLRARIGEAAERVRELKRRHVASGAERGDPRQLLGAAEHQRLADQLAEE